MARLSSSSTDPKLQDSPDWIEQKQRGNKTKTKPQHLPTPALVALAIIVLASATGLVLSITTSAVPRLQTEGDIPNRILLFAASLLSIVEGCLYIVVLQRRRNLNKGSPTTHTRETRKTASIRASVLIISRLLPVAWIASVVLASLLISRLAGVGAAVVSPSAPLAEKAVYADLLISGAALIPSCVLLYYSERSRSLSKRALSTQHPVHDSKDSDLESLGSPDLLDTVFNGETAISTTETISAVSNLGNKTRQKRKLSYKTTAQLIDESQLSVDSSGAVSMAAAEDAKSTSIKRKPVQSSQAPPPAASTFLGHRIGRGDDRMSRTVPFSPAVTRPVSVIPPMPAVPTVPSTETLPRFIFKAIGIKRKPVGAASPQAGPIKRKPVNAVSAAELAPLMPTIVEPASPSPESSMPTNLEKCTPKPQATARRLSVILSSKHRKVSRTSIISTSSIPSPTAPPPSLADMIASSLRRDSSMVYTPSPPARSVTSAQPTVLEQLITRTSLTASGDGFGLPGGSRRNPHRPSGVSFMETVYSPVEEDADLAAMIREEAAAAAAFANAGRSPSVPRSPDVSPPSSLARAARRATTITTPRAVSSPRSPAYPRPGYNFSRPIRSTSRFSVSSRLSASFAYSTTARKHSSAVLSPRSRVRRQLLQMLPAQHQPKPTAVST